MRSDSQLFRNFIIYLRTTHVAMPRFFFCSNCYFLPQLISKNYNFCSAFREHTIDKQKISMEILHCDYSIFSILLSFVPLFNLRKHVCDDIVIEHVFLFITERLLIHCYTVGDISTDIFISTFITLCCIACQEQHLA